LFREARARTIIRALSLRHEASMQTLSSNVSIQRDTRAWQLQVAIGSTGTVSVIGSGVVPAAAGEVLAFVPSAIDRAPLNNEKLS
jgi:hypothetical protein